jgi:amidase
MRAEGNQSRGGRARHQGLPVPSIDELRRINDELQLGFTEDELPGARQAVADALESYRRVDELSVSPRPPRTWDRPAPVAAADNPYGAWMYRHRIEPTDTGVLDGMSVVIKDNIAVAGIPMTIGGALLRDHVPSYDATVVQRVLGAGGTIVGTAACEDLCFSGNSFTNVNGPARNPYDPTRSSGGSSSGCGVLVAIGEADAAIGADQGGSVRGPAAWSGITALKPTYGLVPYTGVAAVELTVDHVGPMARTARDVARMLDALAGPDGHDPRQRGVARETGYLAALGGDVAGVRVAIVREGFGWDGLSEDAVDVPVREAALSLRQLGCTVDEISVPWHRDAIDVFAPIMAEGSAATLYRGNGTGTGWSGFHDTELLRAFHDGWRERATATSLSTKVQFLVGSYTAQLAGGYYYAAAQNLVPALRASYDEVFRAYDVVVMPTLPMSPRVLPTGDLPADVYVAQALDMSCNNCAFNLTGDPSVSVPVGLVDGLPVGMMLSAARGRDASLLRFADVLQRELFEVPRPAVGLASGASS